MSQDDLILDRYEPIGTAGEGGFGTVQIAWDPRIQRKVAIKTIKLTAQDAYRAALPGAQAVAATSTADRWHGAVPWDEYLASEDAGAEGDGARLPETFDDEEYEEGDLFAVGGDVVDGLIDEAVDEIAEEPIAQVTSLSHVPGLDEARTAAMLADPRIVTVYDFEVRGRFAYLIMEYVEGITLTQLLYDYPDLITLDMVAAVFDSVAGALETAHEAGVLHLDIKPDNILINAQGQVKVTDFGLATLADASGSGTTGGGTIGYMPLEQMRREHLDVRSDEWSLAAITYEMLSGGNPFRARSLAEAETAIEDAELVLPSLCWQNLDEQIDDVVFYALDPDREERYASVADFAEEMDKFLGNADEGHEQLALVVADALGFSDEEDEEGYADEEADADAPLSRSSRLLGFVDRVADFVSHPRLESSAGDYGDEVSERYDNPDDVRDIEQVTHEPRKPFVQRVPKWAMGLVTRVFAAASSGFLAAFAFTNMKALQTAFGTSSVYALGALTLFVAAIGVLFPHVGALVAFCLVSIALILCGHPIVGAIVLVLAVMWWYVVGHRSHANANAALSQPLLGSIGGSSIVPFAAGASLEPLPALGTALFASLMAMVFASFGSGSLLGWDAFVRWNIGGVDIAKNLITMITRASTWATIASWVAAAGVLSVARLRGGRIITALGIVAATALVLAGTLVFSPPTPQLLVPTILSAIVLLAVLV